METVKVIRIPNEDADPRDPQFHIFDRERRFVEGVHAADDARLNRELGSAMFGFFEATREGRWVVGERVQDQEW